MKKKCTGCGIEKSLDCFSRQKKGKYGKTSRCRECESNRYKANKEERLKKQKEYYEANKEERLKKQKEYYEANREDLIRKRKNYYEANRVDIIAKQVDYEQKRYSEDPMFRTIKSLRKQTRRLGDHKNKSTIELVGCSPEEFWRRNGSPSVVELEDLHVDHIVPLSWFDLNKEDHVRVACNWTNLQYLSEGDNLKKNSLYAGRPDAILGYKDEFDLEKHVEDMIEFLDSVY